MELFSNEAKQKASVTQVHPELVICRLARKLKSNRAGSDSQLIHTDMRNRIRISLLSLSYYTKELKHVEDSLE